MYFLLLMLKSRRKRSALQPQTIYSEVPLVFCYSWVCSMGASSVARSSMARR